MVSPSVAWENTRLWAKVLMAGHLSTKQAGYPLILWLKMWEFTALESKLLWCHIAWLNRRKSSKSPSRGAMMPFWLLRSQILRISRSKRFKLIARHWILLSWWPHRCQAVANTRLYGCSQLTMDPLSKPLTQISSPLLKLTKFRYRQQNYRLLESTR